MKNLKNLIESPSTDTIERHNAIVKVIQPLTVLCGDLIQYAASVDFTYAAGAVLFVFSQLRAGEICPQEEDCCDGIFHRQAKEVEHSSTPMFQAVR